MSSVLFHPPTSHFPLPTSRAALTLAEVLIAMGLLTLGLLGVAAIFPVGGFYMQSGDIADRSGAIAEAALEDAIVRGYLDPKNWVIHDASSTGANSGLFMPLLQGDPVNNRLGLVGAVADLAAVRNNPTGAAQTLPVLTQSMKSLPEAYTSKLFGGAFAIDPLGMAAALSSDTSPPPASAYTPAVRQPVLTAPMRGFPAALPDTTDTWPDWYVNNLQWPVRRVTPIHTAASLNSNTTYAYQLPKAQQLFTAPDDLALTLPRENDSPAQGLWDVVEGVAGRPAAARLSNRDYSWLLTVAPSSSVGLNALATKADAYPVEVSSVVFHKRAMAKGTQGRLESERTVNADVLQSGASGGELLLTRRASDTITASPFEGLRIGQYVVVFGPHPLSSTAKPMLALRWCRVLSIEKTGSITVGTTTVALDGATRVLISVRGPDWPWAGTATPVATNLRVGILPGAVAVHTKTMRLESATEWAIR